MTEASDHHTGAGCASEADPDADAWAVEATVAAVSAVVAATVEASHAEEPATEVTPTIIAPDAEEPTPMKTTAEVAMAEATPMHLMQEGGVGCSFRGWQDANSLSGARCADQRDGCHHDGSN